MGGMKTPVGALLLSLPLPFGLCLAQERAPSEPAAHLTRFGEGTGPSSTDGVYRLLDPERTPEQSNSVAFDRARIAARIDGHERRDRHVGRLRE